MADETGVTTQAPSYESRLVQFKQAWEKSLPYIQAMVPAHVSPERIFSIAVTARMRNPKLMECTDLSVLRGIIVGAQLGLDVSGVGGKAYLVPYWNGKEKKLQAQFMPGYRGLIELVRRTGQIAAVYGKVVHERDEFEYQDGMQQVLRHIPYMGADDPGQVVGVWTVAVWTNGFRQIHVMSKMQLDKVRASSKAADDGPWVNWYDEMALKSGLKRMCKLLPDSVELARVLDIEDHVEAGLPIPIDIDLGEKAEPPPTRTESIKEELKKNAAKAVAQFKDMKTIPIPPELPVKRGPGRPPKPKPLEVVPLIEESLPEPEPEEVVEPELDSDYD